MCVIRLFSPPCHQTQYDKGWKLVTFANYIKECLKVVLLVIVLLNYPL